MRVSENPATHSGYEQGQRRICRDLKPPGPKVVCRESFDRTNSCRSQAKRCDDERRVAYDTHLAAESSASDCMVLINEYSIGTRSVWKGKKKGVLLKKGEGVGI